MKYFIMMIMFFSLAVQAANNCKVVGFPFNPDNYEDEVWLTTALLLSEMKTDSVRNYLESKGFEVQSMMQSEPINADLGVDYHKESCRPYKGNLKCEVTARIFQWNDLAIGKVIWEKTGRSKCTNITTVEKCSSHAFAEAVSSLPDCG